MDYMMVLLLGRSSVTKLVPRLAHWLVLWLEKETEHVTVLLLESLSVTRSALALARW
jgi:hypothetical protein